MVAAAATHAGPKPSVAWLHGARVDVAVAFAWVPFGILALVASNNQRLLQTLVAAVLMLSFSHQPLTLGLVYADRNQFNARRRMYTWAPLVMAALVLVGLNISLVAVAVVGGLWNTYHTLMQRYGLTRIYRRKGGQAGDGRRDLHLLSAWLLVVLAWAVANPATPDRIGQLSLDPTATRSLEILVDLRPAANGLLACTLVLAVWASVSWWRHERAHGFSANPATYVYLGASAALFAVALAHPIAGLLGWIGAHAVEYYVVVQVHLKTRSQQLSFASGHVPPPAGTVVERVVGTRLGAAGTIVAFTVLSVAAVHVLMPRVGLLPYAVAVFAVGGLHIFYDGFIWKLRQPEVARSLSASS